MMYNHKLAINPEHKLHLWIALLLLYDQFYGRCQEEGHILFSKIEVCLSIPKYASKRVTKAKGNSHAEESACGLSMAPPSNL